MQGPWIQTASGRAFSLTAPRPEDILIEDIAHALSHLCRFTGHTAQLYTVAQHSVLASCAAPPEFALWGLLHDAAEAYLGDVSSPLKGMLPGYRLLEDKLLAAISMRFGLAGWAPPPEVKEVDLRLLFTERRDLLGPPPHQWAFIAEPYAWSVTPCWAPHIARIMFINRFNSLTRRKQGS